MRKSFHVAAALLIVACSPSVLEAESDRRVDCNVATEDDAVIITNVAIGDRKIGCYWTLAASGKYEPPARFAAADDWIKDLTVTLLNRTNKRIDYVLIGLSFPQTNPERTFNVSLGRLPQAAAFDREGRPKVVTGRRLALPAGATLILRGSDYADAIAGTLSPVLVVPLTDVRIHFIGMYFEDGMHWNPGVYSVPDREHAGEWIHLAPGSYFPGNRRAHWPPK